MAKVTRLARRIFRPLLTANGPAKLDLRGVDRDSALQAIELAGDYVRCLDAPDPLEAMYVFTGRGRVKFLPWHKRLRLWIRVFLGA